MFFLSHVLYIFVYCYLQSCLLLILLKTTILLMLRLRMSHMFLMKTLVRTVEQRFEGSGYIGTSNVKGFSKSHAPKASTRRSTRRLLKGAPQSTSTEPVELSDDIEASEDQGVEVGAEKEKQLVVHGKKASAKKVIATPLQGSSSKDVEGLDPDEVYVPGWSVKVDDSFKDAAVCEDVLSHIAPPSVHSTIAEMDDDFMLSQMILSTCNLAAMLPQGVARFHKRMRERRLLVLLRKRKPGLKRLVN
ncbi:hypothetical protein HanPI659440_Chr01g0019241 [Helianthus annuus]|nr:hypothetical protein HanPI659440_Chr01g0019241 [Helianthus annuus]